MQKFTFKNNPTRTNIHWGNRRDNLSQCSIFYICNLLQDPSNHRYSGINVGYTRHLKSSRPFSVDTRVLSLWPIPPLAVRRITSSLESLNACFANGGAGEKGAIYCERHLVPVPDSSSIVISGSDRSIEDVGRQTQRKHKSLRSQQQHHAFRDIPSLQLVLWRRME